LHHPLSLLADGSPENWNLFERHFGDAFVSAQGVERLSTAPQKNVSSWGVTPLG
jgi:hypothetical protein